MGSLDVGFHTLYRVQGLALGFVLAGSLKKSRPVLVAPRWRRAVVSSFTVRPNPKSPSLSRECLHGRLTSTLKPLIPNMGAVRIRIGSWGPLLHNYTHVPPK